MAELTTEEYKRLFKFPEELARALATNDITGFTDIHKAYVDFVNTRCSSIPATFKRQSEIATVYKKAAEELNEGRVTTAGALVRVDEMQKKLSEYHNQLSDLQSAGKGINDGAKKIIEAGGDYNELQTRARPLMDYIAMLTEGVNTNYEALLR